MSKVPLAHESDIKKRLIVYQVINKLIIASCKSNK